MLLFVQQDLHEFKAQLSLLFADLPLFFGMGPLNVHALPNLQILPVHLLRALFDLTQLPLKINVDPGLP